MYRDFDLKTLTQEYSPSSCIDDIGVFIQQYIDQSKQALELALGEDKVISDIPYDECDFNEDKVLDLFLPFQNSKPKKKLHVYIHGGYWQELSKNESSFAATNFQQQGYHFAVINYSLAPNATLSKIVEQNRQALVWLYQHADDYGYNQNEIYLSGSSAGGHLAMMMAMTNWSKYLDVNNTIIKGICAVSGIYDLTPIAQTYINEPLQLSKTEIENYSPLFLDSFKNSDNHCHMVLAYGDNETSEFKRQTLAMKKQLQQLELTTICAEIDDRNHFDVILDLANADSWLSQQVFQQMA